MELERSFERRERKR